jgi:hypothetical protein
MGYEVLNEVLKGLFDHAPCSDQGVRRAQYLPAKHALLGNALVGEHGQLHVGCTLAFGHDTIFSLYSATGYKLATVTTLDRCTRFPVVVLASTNLAWLPHSQALSRPQRNYAFINSISSQRLAY